MRFKAGDTARIVTECEAGHPAASGMHEFKIGDLVTVTEVFLESEGAVEDHYSVERKDGEFWYVGEEDLEEVPA